LSKAKALSLREIWTLARARKLLVCEISEVMGETESAAGNSWTRLSEREKLRLLAGNQIISLSARSVRTCDVSAIGIRLDRVMYGGANVSDIRGIVGK
jgi:hypothetical protein